MQLQRTSTAELIQLSVGLTIGRHQSCGYVIADGSVSRVHGKIEWHDGSFVLHDQQSSNGIFVDGRKQKIIRLRSGLTIALGEVEFTVVDETQAGEASHASDEHRERTHRRREILDEGSSGVLGDLSQQSFAIRALALVASFAVMIGVIYLVRLAGENF
ncbi:MAG: FHA domain-containing protein [Planctomycetota bacterium]|jgi:adenylate cyclase|nr:FHA domain-containing protein [Planctomycetota bacterium]